MRYGVVPIKGFQHKNLLYESFTTQKFPDLYYVAQTGCLSRTYPKVAFTQAKTEPSCFCVVYKTRNCVTVSTFTYTQYMILCLWLTMRS